MKTLATQKSELRKLARNYRGSLLLGQARRETGQACRLESESDDQKFAWHTSGSRVRFGSGDEKINPLRFGRYAIPAFLALCLSCKLAAAPSYSLEWDAVVGGGGVSIAGGYTLVDTVGQPQAGVSINGALLLEAGFLPGLNLQPLAYDSAWELDEDTLLEGSLDGFDRDGDLLRFVLVTEPAQGTLTLEADGTFTYSPAENYFGADSFTFQVRDGEFDSPSATATLRILPVNDSPVAECTLAEQTVQYSDPIIEVSVAATDVDSPGDSLRATTSWQKDGGSVAVGLPDGLTLCVTTTTASSRTWILSGCPQVAPGTYLIWVAVADNEGAGDTVDLSLVVTREDARATYTGALFASTASVSSGIATVTLSATIQDITVYGGDATPGDIRHATVTFVNRDDSTIIAEGVEVGLVDLSDPKTGTATYNWTHDIKAEDSQSIRVGIIVSGWYTRNDPGDDTVVTISKPYASDFITGGGYLSLENSAGLCAGDAGTKANFGFNVKYNKAGRSLQGRINSIIRRAGRVYQIKGNSMTSLSISVKEPPYQATFNGKASIQDITDPLVPISVDGNATLQVTMTDNGEPGSADTIAITVWNKKGGLWFSSNWDGKKTWEQLLAGGNLVVRSGAEMSLSGLGGLQPKTAEPMLLRMDLLPPSTTGAVTHPFVLRFGAVPMADYALEISPDLLNWAHVVTVMSFTDSVEYFDEINPASGSQFYRVRAADENLGQVPAPQSQ